STEDVQPTVVPVVHHESISEPVNALVSASMPNQKASIPFPSRRNDERRREKANNQIEKFYEIFRDLSLSWRLCDFCGIHILLMDNGLAIHMLTEKKYPLSQEMLSKMLSKRLEVDHESSQAFELLKFIRAQVQK
ncbi:hypothetical protein Tco_0830050, partial [Tanacetum coccineum]